jgi:hypothetical protein
MAIRQDIAQVLNELAQRNQIARGELSKRFHRIKRRGACSGPQDPNWIDDQTGDVYDDARGSPGDYIGNVIDDF